MILDSAFNLIYALFGTLIGFLPESQGFPGAFQNDLASLIQTIAGLDDFFPVHELMWVALFIVTFEVGLFIFALGVFIMKAVRGF